jgi:hypothetical protein
MLRKTVMPPRAGVASSCFFVVRLIWTLARLTASPPLELVLLTFWRSQ